MGFVKKFGIIILTILTFLSKSPEVKGNESLKQLLDKLFSNYQSWIRPSYGEKPVKVGLTAYVLSIENIDELNSEFTLTLYLRQSWSDPRLQFNKTAGIGIKGSDDKIVLDSTKSNLIWVPDTFIPNEKTSNIHKLTVPNEFVRISSNGDVLKSQRVTLTAICPMNLRYFPMDQQMCTIEIESFGFTAHDIIYIWSKGLVASIGISSEISNPEFRIIGHRLLEINVALSTGNYSRLVFGIQFQRDPAKYITRYYTPLTMFVSISIMALWLTKTEISALVNFLNVGFINLFMAMAHSGGLRHNYTNSALDNYVKICLYFMYTCLIVSMLNLYFTSNKKRKSESIEMQPIRRADENSILEDTHTLCESQSTRLHNILPASPIQHYWTIFKRIVELVCRHVSWILAILYFLSVCIYWVNLVQASSVQPVDDLVLVESYGM